MLDKVNQPAADNDAVTGNELAVSEKFGTAIGDYDEPVVSAPAAPRRSFWSILGSLILMLIQVILMVAILAGAFVLTKRMISEKPEARKRPPFKTVYTVETITAKLDDYQPSFVSYGQTVAARSVELRSLVSGEIVKVNPRMRAGARVAKGDVLLEIDRFDYLGALSEAKANLAEAQARIVENEAQVTLEQGKLKAVTEQLKFAEDDLKRIESLKNRGASTQKELDARRYTVSQRQQAIDLSSNTITVQKSKLAQIEASIDRLKWRVEQAERNLDSTKLVAPFAGVVRSSTAEIGRAITANDVVVSMYEADTLEVKFTLTDAQYGRLQESPDGLTGRNVEVVWTVGGRDYVYPAKIDRVGAEIASNRGGVELFALVGKSKNAVSIRPGAFVEVRVPDRVFKNTVSIPDSAIYHSDTAYVKVDGKLVKRDVVIQSYEGENALVSSGINNGDEVLITRITEVSEGLAVRLEGEKVQPRAKKQAATGRPDRAEIAEILKKNKLTLEAWRALSIPDRRKLIATHRKAQ